MAEGTCIECGAIFTFKRQSPWQRYCSTACSTRYKRKHRHQQRTCAVCGAFYRGAKPTSRYCSRECQRRARRLPDEERDRRVAETQQRIACLEARDEMYRRARDAGLALTAWIDLVCPPRCTCGQIREKTRRWCERCRAERRAIQMVKVKKNAKVWRKKQRSLGHWSENHRQRARRFSVPYDPQVTRPRVLERDSWTCGICNKPIPNIAWIPQACDQYGTIDHVLPMSQGGGHTWDNVQAAHHLCNSLKGSGE